MTTFVGHSLVESASSRLSTWVNYLRELNATKIVQFIEEPEKPNATVGLNDLPQELQPMYTTWLPTTTVQKCYRATFSKNVTETIPVSLFLFASNDLTPTEKRMMSLWLTVACSKGKQYGCTESLDVYLFLHPAEKELPDQSQLKLTPKNVNSGFNFPCRKNNVIVIYRKEEMMKLLFHESVHAFGLDFATETYPFEGAIRSLQILLPKLSKDIIRSLNLCEAYTETLAECIWWTMNIVFHQPAVSTTLENVEQSWKQETSFGMQQCVKIAHHFNIHSVEDFGNWKEATSVFSYFFVRVATLFDLDTFFEKFPRLGLDARHELDFSLQPSGLQNYDAFLSTKVFNPTSQFWTTFFSKIQNAQEITNKSLRMTKPTTVNTNKKHNLLDRPRYFQKSPANFQTNGRPLFATAANGHTAPFHRKTRRNVFRGGRIRPGKTGGRNIRRSRRRKRHQR